MHSTNREGVTRNRGRDRYGGDTGSLTAAAYTSSVGARYWASDYQGAEETWPPTLSQNDTQIYIKLQNTPRDSMEHGYVEEDAKGKGDRRKWRKPLGNGRGMGRWSNQAGRGADVRAT